MQGICEVCNRFGEVHGLTVVHTPPSQPALKRFVGHIILVCPPRPHDPQDCMRVLVFDNPGVIYDMLPDGSWTLPGASNPQRWK